MNLNAGRIQQVPLERIEDSPTNPRKTFDAPALSELTENIKQHGILVPLLVRIVGGHFEVVFGARRLRAATILELSSVPCLVHDIADAEVLELQLIEAIQRQDITPADEAECYRTLMEQCGYSAKALAERISKTAQHIWARLQLLNLEAIYLEQLREGKLGVHKAQVLARLTPEEQQRCAEAAENMPPRVFAAHALLIRQERNAPRSKTRDRSHIAEPQIVTGLRRLLKDPCFWRDPQALDAMTDCTIYLLELRGQMSDNAVLQTSEALACPVDEYHVGGFGNKCR